MNMLSDLDKAWSDIYWTFSENAFDISDDHIGRYPAPGPLSTTNYFQVYAEVPF